MEGGRVIARQCAPYCDCVLVIRVAGVWVGVARSQGVGVGKNWVLGISVGTNIGAGRVRWVLVSYYSNGTMRQVE